ncbi:MAG: hypothetical protein ACE5QW_07345 [Thermoplasmata archaeon]
MTEYRAEVKPDQDWKMDGTADVTPLPPFPDPTPVKLPLEHREGGPVTIKREEYPEGLVIIPTDTELTGEMAVLPMEVSDGGLIEIGNEGEHQSWPDGIVGRFTEA